MIIIKTFHIRIRAADSNSMLFALFFFLCNEDEWSYSIDEVIVWNALIYLDL
jgi:hypothetical protein